MDEHDNKFNNLLLPPSNASTHILKQFLLSHLHDIQIISRFFHTYPEHSQLINFVDGKTGKSLLMYSLEKHEFELTTRWLITEQNVDIYHLDHNQCDSLIYAALLGSVDIVKLLILHGGDPHHKTKSGLNILMIAAYERNVELLQFLLLNTNQIKPSTNPLNSSNLADSIDYNIPLDSTALSNQLDRANHFVDFSTTLDNDASQPFYLINPNLTLPNGATALSLAIQAFSPSDHNRSIKCIKILLENGADVNKALFEDNITPLMIACQHDNAHDSLELIRILLSHGANVNIQQSTTGESALHLFISSFGHSNQNERMELRDETIFTRILWELILAGGDLNLPNHNNQTPFMRCFINSKVLEAIDCVVMDCQGKVLEIQHHEKMLLKQQMVLQKQQQQQKQAKSSSTQAYIIYPTPTPPILTPYQLRKQQSLKDSMYNNSQIDWNHCDKNGNNICMISASHCNEVVSWDCSTFFLFHHAEPWMENNDGITATEVGMVVHELSCENDPNGGGIDRQMVAFYLLWEMEFWEKHMKKQKQKKKKK